MNDAKALPLVELGSIQIVRLWRPASKVEVGRCEFLARRNLERTLLNEGAEWGNTRTSCYKKERRSFGIRREAECGQRWANVDLDNIRGLQASEIRGSHAYVRVRRV